MGYLFLDIETFVDKKNKDSGLNPFEEESKVILISYNHYKCSQISESDLRSPVFLKEWDSNEKQILTDFYNLLKTNIPKDKYEDSDGNLRCGFKIIGYNITGFDLPYLFSRMLVHNIDSYKNLYNFLFREPIKIDLMNISTMISKKVLNFNELLPISQKNANRFFGLPVKKGNGLYVSDYYANKDFDSIMKYAKEEFTFEKLYFELKNHIIDYQSENMASKLTVDHIFDRILVKKPSFDL